MCHMNIGFTAFALMAAQAEFHKRSRLSRMLLLRGVAFVVVGYRFVMVVMISRVMGRMLVMVAIRCVIVILRRSMIIRVVICLMWRMRRVA